MVLQRTLFVWHPFARGGVCVCVCVLTGARELQPTAREFATAVMHKPTVQPSSELTFSPYRSLTIFDLGTEYN